jgi:hypothetical protein
MIQGPCVKERERKIATIQNQCRWLHGVESLELQKVARTIGPARMRETADEGVSMWRTERTV